jgi:hypothetical protein
MITCKKHILRFIVLCAILLLAACVSQPRMSVDVLPEYDALFDRKAGWTGADGAYTVSLSGNRILWLFGDTWYGEIRDGRHENAVIVNNSIAIQRGLSPPEASIRFYAGKAAGGRPPAFFRPADGRGWLWMYDGILTANGLYLFLIQLDRTPELDSFGFKIIGSWLGHVNNPADSPDNWRLSQHRIPWARFSPLGDTLFGSALMRAGPFIYIYGVTEEVVGGIRNKSMILARVFENRIEQFDQWEFFAGGKWTTDFNQSSRLGDGMANEYSVSYLSGLKKYIVVYTENGFSRNIVLRFAPDPGGPWSEPQKVYACPEMDLGADVFCYAAKGHPDLAPSAGEIIVTYVANSLDFDRIAADAELYRPRFLRVRFNIIE